MHKNKVLRGVEILETVSVFLSFYLVLFKLTTNGC